MRYRNLRTGNIIESECELSGGDWQPLGAAVPVIKQEKAKPEKKPVEFDEDDDSDLDEVAPVQPKKGKKK